jgi:hypothetical protein
MHYEISQQAGYLRAVIGDAANLEDFASFYAEVQKRCAVLGLDRALVIVRPEDEVPGPERLANFKGVDFVVGFKLALVCATWTLYQACNKAETVASRAAVNMRAFLQEMEAVSWLKAR